MNGRRPEDAVFVSCASCAVLLVGSCIRGSVLSADRAGSALCRIHVFAHADGIRSVSEPLRILRWLLSWRLSWKTSGCSCWLVAPIFSPAAMAIEAYSLLWCMQDMRPAERRPSVLIAIQSRRADRARW